MLSTAKYYRSKNTAHLTAKILHAYKWELSEIKKNPNVDG